MKELKKRYVAIFVLTTLLPLLFYFYHFGPELSDESIEWANLGTFYGGLVGPLLSLAAFIGVLITIKIQNDQLKLQSDQIKNQNEESVEQKKMLQKQAFENMLFKLIELNLSLTNSLEAQVGLDKFNGQILITHIYRILLNNYLNTLPTFGTFDNNAYQVAYKNFYKEYANTIAHFCRNTYTILKTIDESSIENKKMYSDIFKATLSNNEFGILAFNAISPEGRKMKELIEKYGFLQNFYEDKIVWQITKTEFRESAFT